MLSIRAANVKRCVCNLPITKALPTAKTACNLLLNTLYFRKTGRSAARLARLLWEQEVPSSNLGAPTIDAHPNVMGIFLSA